MPYITVPPTPLLHDPASRILKFLWRSRTDWSGREIARQVGLSAPACHATLKKLDAQGLVHLRRVSNVHLYKINHENYFVRNVFARRFGAEDALPREVAVAAKRALVGGSPILCIAVFGSMARGTAELGSDLDLLVVLPAKTGLRDLEPRIGRLRGILFERFSVPLSPYIQTLAELRRKHHARLPLIQEILKEGRTIYGKDLGELLA